MALNTTGLTLFADTRSALILRDAASRNDGAAILPSANTDVAAPQELRRQRVNAYDSNVLLNNRKPLQPQADLSSRSRQALNAYQQTEQVEQRDELSQLFGVDLFV